MSANTPDIADTLKKAETERKQAITDVNAKFDNLIKEKIAGLRSGVISALTHAKNIYLQIPTEWRKPVSHSKDFTKLAKALGLQSISAAKVKARKIKKTKKTKRTTSATPRLKLGKDEVFDFIATGQWTVGQINDHFADKASSVTIAKRLKELEDDDKVEWVMKGTAKLYHKL